MRPVRKVIEVKIKSVSKQTIMIKPEHKKENNIKP